MTTLTSTKKLWRALLAALLVASASAAGCIQSLGGASTDTGDDIDPATDDNGTDTGVEPPASDNQTTAPPRVINDAPTATFTIHNDVDPKNTTKRGFKGDVLMFDARGSTDPDGYIEKWQWEIFEPAGTEDAPEPTMTFEGEVVKNVVFGTEGVKIIKLIVTDNLGKQNTDIQTYYRDVSYAYGDQFHWSNVQETVTEEREHLLPVISGAAILAAHIVVDGAKARIALIDPDGVEHVAGETETDNVTIVMDHMAPAPGDWKIKVTITYTPTEMCLEGECLPIPFSPSHDASYGLDGLVWYGEKPAEVKAGDGHGHAH